MNCEIEELIVSSFIVSERKNRAKYLLSNSKKRDEFVWNLVNKSYFNSKCIIEIKDNITGWQDIYNVLKMYDFPENCYLISADSNLDGKIYNLKDALKHIVFYGPALISCSQGNIAYYEGEENYGTFRCVLIKTK